MQNKNRVEYSQACRALTACCCLQPAARTAFKHITMRRGVAASTLSIGSNDERRQVLGNATTRVGVRKVVDLNLSGLRDN